MANYSNPDYLHKQYGDLSNLDARVALHARFSTSPIDWQRWVFDQLDLPAEARVLELGSGPGWLWRGNVERIPAGWTVTLSDFSPGMVETAAPPWRTADTPCVSNRSTPRRSPSRMPPWTP